MKRKARLISACIAFILLIGAYFAIQAIFSSPQQSQEQSPVTLFSVDKSLVDSISFTAGGEKLKLIKESDGFWYLSDDKSFPVDQDIVKSMLTVISPMYQIMTVSEECQDPSVYGLDKGIKVDIHYGQKTLSFTLGDTSSAVEGCYLGLAESKAVYLADISSSVAFNHKNKYSIISIDKYPVFTADSLSEVKISSSNKTLELLKEPKGFKAHLGTWAMLRNEKSYPLNETLSDELLYLVKDISFKECVFYKPDETKLNELFKSGAQLEVTYIHSVKNEDETSKDTPVDFSLLLSEKTETGSYYAKLKSSDMVCTVDGKSVEAILSFLNKDILDTRIFGFDESKLGSIKLTKGEESHVLKKTVVKDPNEQSTLIKYELDSTPMSSDASEKLTTLISKAKADSLIDFTPSSTPEISFEFILSDESSYAVNFYSLDNESFAVESDGLCFKAVKKSNIEDIIKLFSK